MTGHAMDLAIKAARAVEGPPGPRRRRGRRGMVLIVVMVVILMISLAGMSFVALMSTENKAAHVRGEELQLAGLVDSGGELLGALLELPPERRREAGGCFDNPDLFRAVLVFDDPWTGRRGRFSVVSPRVEEGQITGLRFGAENESARLNLAVLPRWEETQPGAGRAALMSLPGMTETIADAILDWIDADRVPRQFGAEADYYAGLNVPYAPRNALPAFLEELLLVKGVTRALLFGADANFNYHLEAEELPGAAGRSGSFRTGGDLPWASLLTVYSAEQNVGRGGKPRIDLNDNDLVRLHQRLSEVYDQPWADFIILYRQFGPYGDSGRGGPGSSSLRPNSPRPAGGESVPYRSARVAGKTADRAKTPKVARRAGVFAELDLAQPAAYRISSVLELIGARVAMPAAAPPARSRRVVESPFADDLVEMRRYLPELLDRTSVVAAKIIRGRINVNLAPREVLRAVPGLDGAMVEQIVAARRGPGAVDDPNRRHPTWLLTDGLFDLAQMKALMPYLTAGGDVFRAQVVGYFDGRGAAARAEMVVDATTTPPRRIYWKDLRLLGRGYPLETLGQGS